MNSAADTAVGRLVKDSLESRTLTAERVVLSAILNDPAKNLEKAQQVLEPSDFFDELHRAMFEQMAESVANGDAMDPAMFGEKVARRVAPDLYPGIHYLRKLVAMPEATSDVQPYAQVVLDHALRRRLNERVARWGKRAAGTDVGAIHEVLVAAQHDLDELIARSRNRTPESFASMSRFTDQAMDLIQETLDKGDPEGITGVRTGFPELDRETQGLQGGDLVVLAARPSMGKTSLAMNVAEHVALGQGLPVAIFSMEMGGAALAMRMLSAKSGIDSRRLRSGQLHDHEWSTLLDASESVKGSKLWIETKGAVTPNDIRRRCREIVAREGCPLGLIVVDYLQLMVTGSNSAPPNRAQQVAEISRELKEVGKEMQAPVLALSQLNRSLELRPDKRPILADLRESGAIEQDADVILFIYRDEVYNPKSPHPGIAELIIGKQRNGPIGMVKLRFVKETSKFEPIAS